MFFSKEQVAQLAPHLRATYTISKSTDACPVLSEIFFMCLANTKAKQDTHVMHFAYQPHIPTIFQSILNVEDLVKRKLRRIQSKRYAEEEQIESLEEAMKQGLYAPEEIIVRDTLEAHREAGYRLFSARVQRSLQQEMNKVSKYKYTTW